MTVEVQQIFILLIVFQIKHFVADFPLQKEYMLTKADRSWSFLKPLVLHCLVHGGLTLSITLYFAPHLWWLCFIDFTIHFLMDRIKSGHKYLGRFNDMSKPSYWNSVGIDQMVHHFTNYLMIYLILYHTSSK